MINEIQHISALKGLKAVPDKTINTIVTSPPYYGLRDYGTPPERWPAMSYTIFGFTITVEEMTCELGLEETPEAFVGHMVYIFREAKRALRDDGTLWLNIGDSYWGGKGKSGSQSAEKAEERNHHGKALTKKWQQLGGMGVIRPTDKRHRFVKAKDMTGIPWMLAFALRDDGWYLRQDIIWNKPNPMPESSPDRCTKAHEYIFLLSKSKKYYFDQEAIKTPVVTHDSRTRYAWGRAIDGSVNDVRKGSGQDLRKERSSGNKERKPRPGTPDNTGKNQKGSVPWEGETANKRSVWTVTTKPFNDAHFAVFPQDLIIDCIKAGCPKDGIVCDPFVGSGTTAIVSRKLDRNFIVMDINGIYVHSIAATRMNKELGMFK